MNIPMDGVIFQDKFESGDSYMQGGKREMEAGYFISHGILLLDGSGTMRETEQGTGQPKHRAVAAMVQDTINAIKTDMEIEDILLSVICYDGKRIDDIREFGYDVKESDEFFNEDYQKLRDSGNEDDRKRYQTMLDKWDPLIGHGGATPIGRALKYAGDMAEEWVMSAPIGVIHRAVICLLTDGMNYPASEPNGLAEKERIVEFNQQQEGEAKRENGNYKGYIRIATLGYYQNPPGARVEEDEGRALLKQLAHAPGMPNEGYYENAKADQFARFIKSTVAAS